MSDMGLDRLRRTLQRYVEDQLAEELLKGSYEEGAVVKGKVDKKAEQLSFSISKKKG